MLQKLELRFEKPGKYRRGGSSLQSAASSFCSISSRKDTFGALWQTSFASDPCHHHPLPDVSDSHCSSPLRSDRRHSPHCQRFHARSRFSFPALAQQSLLQKIEQIAFVRFWLFFSTDMLFQYLLWTPTSVHELVWSHMFFGRKGDCQLLEWPHWEAPHITLLLVMFFAITTSLSHWQNSRILQGIRANFKDNFLE